jgi:RNA polymerase sigma factor (TIGR02999 family)
VLNSFTDYENTGVSATPPLHECSELLSEPLFAALYSELHRLARCQLARCAAPVTMSATTLIHGAYIEIAKREGLSFPDPPRFIGYAARVMRGLIIDYVRNRRAQKRGCLFEMTSCTLRPEGQPIEDRDLLMIRDALDELATVDEALAELVNLKFFCGFSFSEIAAMRNESVRTVQRAWHKARLYLYQNLRPVTRQ